MIISKELFNMYSALFSTRVELSGCVTRETLKTLIIDDENGEVIAEIKDGVIEVEKEIFSKRLNAILSHEMRIAGKFWSIEMKDQMKKDYDGVIDRFCVETAPSKEDLEKIEKLLSIA